MNHLKYLEEKYPGLSFEPYGEQKEQIESMQSMKQGFILALFAIYFLLVLPFNSYSQPFIIMLAIPFGFVGAVFGHIIMGYDLTMLSMFGLVALAGVVVNDSILIIDRINSNISKGLDVLQAVIDAGQRRLRPILLTSLTTFFGLTPMIFETSLQAKFLIPMAISLGFGIMFATLIILVLIPAFYMVFKDFKIHQE
jgi:multidrug efflux pump subunit AcrB